MHLLPLQLVSNDSIAISLGLTILTACLQLHVCICVGVDKQLLPHRNAVCVGCGTSTLCCDQRKIIEQYFILANLANDHKFSKPNYVIIVLLR